MGLCQKRDARYTMNEICKLLYRRKAPSGVGNSENLESVWNVYGERIRLTIYLSEYGAAYAQILTRNRNWADLETLHRETNVRCLFELSDKGKPCQCSIEKAANEDEEKLLELIVLLLEPGCPIHDTEQE